MIDRNSSVPLYLQIKNDIVAQMENGTIKIGDKLMSENEMMQHYNVGRVTIRSALSALAALDCLKKEQGLGTFCIAKPNVVKQMNIDVFLNCSDTYLIPFLLAGINRVLERESCNLLLHDTKNSVQNINRLFENVLERGTDGIIIQNPFLNVNFTLPVPTMRAFSLLNIPVVCVCGEFPGDCVSLRIDDRYGAKIAAQYLLDCGHRNILGLFPDEDYGVDARFNGVASTIEKQSDALFHVLRTKNIAQDADEIIRTVYRQRISAIVCYNDFYAVQCMHVLQERGFRIPEDISIIGFDDTMLSISAVPQLTTVSHPKDHMGSDAARTLLQMINGSMSRVSQTIYRPELVIRQSVLDISNTSV